MNSRSFSFAQRRAERAARKAAAEWLALREARGFTASEHASFAEWRAARDCNAAAFAEIEASWRTLDQLRAYPHSSDEADNPDLLARAARQPVGRRLAFPAIAAMASMAAGLALWFYQPWSALHQPTVEEGSVATRLIQLSDGSEVELNVGGEVREQFSPQQRRVELLRGEAHFSVTKNPQRPFVVVANGLEVKAVGTAFNVRMDRAAVEVLVTEGRVQVEPSTSVEKRDYSDAVTPSTAEVRVPATVLSMGQRTTVSTKAAAAHDSMQVETLSQDAINRALAWQSGQFVFEATPLREVITRFNRRTDAGSHSPRIVLEDHVVGELRVSGRIHPDHLEDFVEVLSSSFGVVAEYRGEFEIVLRKAP